MDHKQVRFDTDQMLNDPPIFAEAFIDYGQVAIDPRKDPINILYAFNNKGNYPAAFIPELERFLEDQNKSKITKKESNIKGKVLELFIRMIASERD